MELQHPVGPGAQHCLCFTSDVAQRLPFSAVLTVVAHSQTTRDHAAI